MLDSVWLHRRQSTRLLRPWDFSRQEHWSGLPLPSPNNPVLCHLVQIWDVTMKTWVSVLTWVCAHVGCTLQQCTCGFPPVVSFHVSRLCMCIRVYLSVSLSFHVLAFISLSPSHSFFISLSLPLSLIICLSSSLLYNWSHINPNCIFFFFVSFIMSCTHYIVWHARSLI